MTSMDTSMQKEWKGYTLDEIRIRRIMCLTRIELERSKLMTATQSYTNVGSRLSSVPIVGKLYSALDYIDYATLAFNIVKKAMKIFRHRKK